MWRFIFQTPSLIKKCLCRFAHTSCPFELIGPLHSGILFSKRLLFNNVDVRFKRVKAKSAFTLMSATGTEFNLNIMHFCEKGPSVTGYHAGSFSRSNKIQWNLPVSRVVVKNYSIPAPSRVCSQDNLYLGRLRKYIVVGLVDHRSFVRTREVNPFKFQTCKS